jgi:hypothetical protein
MAGLSILQIVQQAEAELGLPQGTSVYTAAATNTDTQLGALANRCADEMRRMPATGWTDLQWEYNIAVIPPLNTTGDLPLESHDINNVPSGIISQLQPNYWQVAGPGIPVAARIVSISGNTVTMNMENSNTTNLTGQSIQFQQDTYPIPTGFDWFQNRSMWDRTNRWELIGPDSPQLDQWHRSGIVVTGPRRHFRKIGPYANCFRIWPAPAEITQPMQLVFEYMSLGAVAINGNFTDGASFAQYFANDDDQFVLDDNALIMGIKWMFWEVKGFGSYVTLQNRWVDYVKRLIARDGAAPTLPMVNRTNPIFISPANTQDGFFPGPVGPNQGI